MWRKAKYKLLGAYWGKRCKVNELHVTRNINACSEKSFKNNNLVIILFMTLEGQKPEFGLGSGLFEFSIVYFVKKSGLNFCP